MSIQAKTVHDFVPDALARSASVSKPHKSLVKAA